eukprot:942368-Rhodomonas_salina.2
MAIPGVAGSSIVLADKAGGRLRYLPTRALRACAAIGLCARYEMSGTEMAYGVGRRCEHRGEPSRDCGGLLVSCPDPRS